MFSDEIRELFLEWLKYKSEKGQTYKTTGLKGFLVRIMRECGGDPDVLRDMILYSTSNNYDGLFKDKSKGDGNKRNKDGSVPATEQEIAAIIAGKFGSDATSAA